MKFYNVYTKHKNLLRVTVIGICMVSLFTACLKPKELSKLLGRLIVPSDVESIKDGEHANQDLTSVNLAGTTLKRIGKNAFKGNNLKEVVLNKEITELGEGAFTNRKDASQTLPTFKVPTEDVMKLVIAQLTTTDSDGNKVLPSVETTDENTLSTKTIRDYMERVKGDKTVPTIPNAPTIESTPMLCGKGTAYNTGDEIKVAVTFDEEVYVSGTPQMILYMDGNGEKLTLYESGSGTATLIFVYTVKAGDNDLDGISIAADKLNLNHGTIKDKAGNNPNLRHVEMVAQLKHMVDAKAYETNLGASWKQVDAGWYHTMAIDTDGTLYGWGLNMYGQLGMGYESGNKLEPTKIGDKAWKQVAVGREHTVAIDADGCTLCVGKQRIRASRHGHKRHGLE